MKKILSAIFSVIMMISICSMTGCSDFDFNPIGVWEYTDEVLYVDGKEFLHRTKETMQYESMQYIFEKSGTGYITVDGDRALSFTYDYDDSKIILHMLKPKDNKHLDDPDEFIDMIYTLQSDKNKMVRTQKDSAKDENGKLVNLKAEYTLTKN